VIPEVAGCRCYEMMQLIIQPFPQVCDFGLSRFLEGPDQSHISNARQGTPFYIAPEVLMQVSLQGVC
jgi:serine/threonine protein kinase